MIKRYGDIISSAVFLVVIVIYYTATFELNTKSVGGNALVPRLLSLVMGTSCLYILVTASIKLYREKKSKPETTLTAAQEEKETPSDYKKVTSTLVLISLYAIFFPLLGFAISTILYLSAQIYLLTPKHKKKKLPPLILALIFTAFIYAIFTYVFFLVLPSGSIWYGR
jgi:uncharacterized BrkB/YihY/UPF0761 family membrane protein